MRLNVKNKANSTNTTIQSEDSLQPLANQFNNLLIEGTKLTTYQDILLTAPIQINALGIVQTGSAVLTLTGGNFLGDNEFSLVITQEVHYLTEPNTGNLLANNDNLIVNGGDNLIVNNADNYNYKFWRLTASIPTVINHFYLGKYMQLGGVFEEPTPEYSTTDIEVSSVGGQSYNSQGITLKSYDKIRTLETDDFQFEEFFTWWLSSDRMNHFMFVLFENDITTFPYQPFYAKLNGNGTPTRDKISHEWELSIREVK